MQIILRNTKQIFALFLKIRGGINERSKEKSDRIAYDLASTLVESGVCDAHLEWPELVSDVIAAYACAQKRIKMYYGKTKKDDRTLYAIEMVCDAIRAWVREAKLY